MHILAFCDLQLRLLYAVYVCVCGIYVYKTIYIMYI